MMRRFGGGKYFTLLLLLLLLASCQAEIGSDAWCEDMHEKPKGDWTANEVGAYVKHCIF